MDNFAWPPSCTLLLSSFKSGLKTHFFRQAFDSCDIHWWNNLSQNISSTCRGDNVDIKYTTTTTTKCQRLWLHLVLDASIAQKHSIASPGKVALDIATSKAEKRRHGDV